MVICIILAVLGAAFIVTALISTFTLRTTRLEVPIKNLPDEFDGFRLVQISDLHNASFGKGNRRLVSRIKKSAPDCVLVTGDFAGGVSFEKPEKGAFHRLCLALKPLPVYVSLGNHELRLVYRHMDLFEKQLADLEQTGCLLLHNSARKLERGGAHINLYGLSLEGARHRGVHPFRIPEGVLEGPLKPADGEVNILMAHVPQFFPQYADAGFDLVLSGHIHGGIVRIPGLGGVFSPARRLFPEYCYGLYERGRTKMFVSAGLGRALIPLRFLCRPEVVEIVLKKAE